MMKKCFTCKSIKPFLDFSKNNAKKDGLNSNCRGCMAIRDANWRKENLEKSNACVANYRANNMEKIKASQKIWREANPEVTKAATLTWRAENKDRHKDNGARWFSENPEKRRAYSVAWRLKNPEKAKARDEKSYLKNRAKRLAQQFLYRENNKEKMKAHSAKCRAHRLERVPKWLTDSDKNSISQCYSMAKKYSDRMCLEVHVDHVIPMRGKNVSGLHVPWNLRIVLSKENLKKGIKWNASDETAKSLTFEDTIEDRLQELLFLGNL